MSTSETARGAGSNPVTPGQSVIAAVGRSGTTIIHRLLLEIYADCCGTDFDCLYEPFVWDSDVVGHYPKDKSREPLFQSRDAISDEGLFLHTQIPLFGDGTGVRPEVASLAQAYLKGNRARPLLGKFIRANGRLGLLDRLYPDGRFLLVLRNPLDVVNSVLPMFSFYGAEFHRNDFPRFAAQVKNLFGVTLPAEQEIPPAYKAGLWCHFMNLAAVQHAKDRPNYRVIVYEDFAAHREAYGRLICEHIGAPFKDTYDAVIAAPVGRIAKGPPVLSSGDVASLDSMFAQYLALIASLKTFGPVDGEKIRRKYAGLPSAGTYDPRGLGWSPARLEREYSTQRRMAQEAASAVRARLADVQCRTLSIERPGTHLKGPVSVVVAGAGTEADIRRSIDSARRQSYPLSDIIIAAPGVTERFDDIPCVRAVSPDDAASASAAFVAILSTGDEMHPAKLEREVQALRGAQDAVAFSDWVQSAPAVYGDCSWLVGLTGRDALVGMLSRQAALPRNMLMSKDLFSDVGGLGESRALALRVAGRARHWLYTGAAGTLRAPNALRPFIRTYEEISALCVAYDAVAAHHAQIEAFAALSDIVGIAIGAVVDLQRKRDTLTPRIDAVFAEIHAKLLASPVTTAGEQQAFLGDIKYLIGALGFALGEAGS